MLERAVITRPSLVFSGPPVAPARPFQTAKRVRTCILPYVLRPPPFASLFFVLHIDVFDLGILHIFFVNGEMIVQ